MKIRLTCVHHEALMIDCIVHDVPFPAYETFDHRQNLPRRFFLFFDKLFRVDDIIKNCGVLRSHVTRDETT
jgi:hypothetical protein